MPRTQIRGKTQIKDLSIPTHKLEEEAKFVMTDGRNPFIANQNMGAKRITNAQNPVDPQDYATKAYVDSGSSSGGFPKQLGYIGWV